MKLIRNQFREDGIFGQLFKDDDSFFCHTLEHAFTVSDGISRSPFPAVDPGQYLCVRGSHQLASMK